MVVTLEESKNLSKIKLEPLQDSLEARKLRIKERESGKAQEKVVEQALLAHANKKNGYGRRRRRFKIGIIVLEHGCLAIEIDDNVWKWNRMVRTS